MALLRKVFIYAEKFQLDILIKSDLYIFGSESGDLNCCIYYFLDPSPSLDFLLSTTVLVSQKSRSEPSREYSDRDRFCFLPDTDLSFRGDEMQIALKISNLLGQAVEKS